MAALPVGTPLTRRGAFGRAAQTAAALGAALAGAARTGPVQAGVAPQAHVSGKFQAVTVLDFHPDHNAYLRSAITEFAAQKGWELDLSDLNAFLGGSDVYQKLQAQKAAGQPVDLIVHHGLSARLESLYQLTRDATPIVEETARRYGRPFSGARATWVIDGKWQSLPYYVRAEGYWLRKDKFGEIGLGIDDPLFSTWQGMLQAAKLVTRPEQKFYGWGNTVNRCGDGEYLTQNVMYAWGGALADPTGQIVTLFSPETIDAMTWLSDIYLNPANAAILPPGVNSWNDTGNNEAWLAGSVAFTFNAGTLYAKSVFDGVTLPDGTLLSDATGVVQAPIGPYGLRMQTSSGAGLHFMSGSRNFDAAVELATHLLTPAMMDPLYRTSYGYVLPAYEAQWDHPFITENIVAKSFKPVAFLDPPFVGLAHRGPVSEAADAVGAQNVMTDMMGEILAGKPVIAAVRDAHLRTVDIFKSFGFKGM